MTGRVYVLMFVLVTGFLQAYAQDSVYLFNQKRIEDLRARVSKLSDDDGSTDSLIIMLKQVIRQQRDSLKLLSDALSMYEIQARRFGYSRSCNCYRIYYGLEKEEANYAAYTELDSLALLMLDNHAMQLKLVGHADKSGTASFNHALALKRAVNLKAYLVRKHHLTPDRIAVEERGSNEHITGISDPYLFHLNRRVEVFLVSP